MSSGIVDFLYMLVSQSPSAQSIRILDQKLWMWASHLVIGYSLSLPTPQVWQSRIKTRLVPCLLNHFLRKDAAHLSIVKIIFHSRVLHPCGWYGFHSTCLKTNRQKLQSALWKAPSMFACFVYVLSVYCAHRENPCALGLWKPTLAVCVWPCEGVCPARL